ncbi:MAG TPA: hypothetical protein VHV31_14485 [Nitrolancea sp.]|nr:hypothetical protein [Nitrolancea sp.]
MGNRHVVLWGNTDLYVIDRDGYSLTAFPQDEPILAAFPIDHRWCLVREISIVIVDLDRRTIEEIFDYDEVLRTYRWNGNRLFVKDFYGRQLTFDVSTGVPSLRRGPFYSFQ